MNKTERLDHHWDEIFKTNKRLDGLERSSDSMNDRLKGLFKWLGIKKPYFVFISGNDYNYIFPDPRLQQQLDAICDHLKIDVKVTQPVGKKVIAKRRHHPKKKKSPSKS